MFHHFGIVVKDFQRSLALYRRCLAPLGIHVVEEGEDWAIFQRGSNVPFMWLGSARPAFWSDANIPGVSPAHLAFVARDRAAVDAFYQAAIAMGATDNGGPQCRKSWTNFYSAFVLDLDGNNMEATVQE